MKGSIWAHYRFFTKASKYSPFLGNGIGNTYLLVRMRKKSMVFDVNLSGLFKVYAKVQLWILMANTFEPVHLQHHPDSTHAQ